jgi:RNA polymerase sigma factor (sigma-70 family)
MSATRPFQSFVEEHRTHVYRFLLVAAGPGEADDLFQETFLAALRAYPTLEHEGNLRGWILSIASRKAIDASRRRSRRASPIADVALVADTTSDDDMEAFDPNDPLWQAVRALPPRQRVALVHRVVLDRSYAEIAEAMGTDEAAARANLYQALKKLRERWIDDED